MTAPRVDPGQAAAEERVGALVGRVLVAVAVLAAVGAVVPAARWLAGVAIGVLVASPLARVAWLARRWWAIGDRRFALVAVALLALVAVGPLAALLAG
ncbi:MAG: hypothetical protein ACKORC_04445 [Acidimicrobiia bacterium]